MAYKDPEKARASARKSYWSHREDRLAYNRQYRIDHAEQLKAQEQAYNEAHRIKQRDAQRIIRKRRRIDVLQAYGGSHPKCACCGEAESLFLTIHHVNGDGKNHRKSIGNSNMYQWLVQEGYPEGFQVLCMNCNSALGFFGFCPHQASGPPEPRP